MFVCDEPQTALPPEREVGLKPPWNQPQVTLWRFRSSPTFVPVMLAVSVPEQSSNAGSGSPMIVPLAISSGAVAAVVPCVLPDTRLIAPGVDGPKVVPNELSFSA